MVLFDKTNKGFTNAAKINCFMNVCLQSLFACPAFFNMLQAMASTPDIEDKLDPDGFLKKLVHTSRFFDPKYQLDRTEKFASPVVNGEKIFESFLSMYNPDNEQ